MDEKKQEFCKGCVIKSEAYEKTIKDILDGVEEIITTQTGHTNIFNNLKLLIQNYRDK